MSFRVVECEQRSPDWFASRLGRLTSSTAADMLATRKDKSEAAGRRNLRMRLLLERLTGKSQESGFQSEAMLVGIQREAAAIAAYEGLTGAFVQRVGFLAHTELLAGASLDGYVGQFEGLVEAKSPQPATHWDYLRSGTIPGDYLAQITHQLWMVPQAQWCDWLSYQPDFPAPLDVKLVRVRRQDVDLAAYDKAVRAFLADVDNELAAVKTLRDLKGTLEAACLSS